MPRNKDRRNKRSCSEVEKIRIKVSVNNSTRQTVGFSISACSWTVRAYQIKLVNKRMEIFKSLKRLNFSPVWLSTSKVHTLKIFLGCWGLWAEHQHLSQFFCCGLFTFAMVLAGFWPGKSGPISWLLAGYITLHKTFVSLVLDGTILNSSVIKIFAKQVIF